MALMKFQAAFRKALFREALMSNISWAIIGGSVAMSVILQDPFVLAIGAGLETAAVLAMMSSQKFVRRVVARFDAEDARKKRMKLDETVKHSDPESRNRYIEIMHSAEEIENLAHESDSTFLTTGLISTISQLETLREKSASLLEKRLLIRRYLSSVDLGALEKDCQKQEKAVAVIQDPVARRQFQQSLGLKREQLETYRSMFVALQRIDGQLEQISATLSSIKGKIVLLKTSEVTTEGGYDQMGEELTSLIGDVELMEDSVEEAAGSLSTARRAPPARVAH